MLTRVLIAASLMACHAGAGMAQVTGGFTLDVAPAPLAEVEVNAQREKLSVLRAAIRELEDRFYDEYNRANRIDRFDVDCADVAGTGTRLKRRDCRPVFVSDATSLELRQMGDTSYGTGQAPASIVIATTWPRFQRHMRDVIARSPRLQELLQHRALLERRLAALEKEKHAGRFAVVD
jgi:hypothetical protein